MLLFFYTTNWGHFLCFTGQPETSDLWAIQLINPNVWRNSLFKQKMGVKWLISSRSRQFIPPILNLWNNPFMACAICVTLQHRQLKLPSVGVLLVETLKNSFPPWAAEFYIYTNISGKEQFFSWELLLKYVEQTTLFSLLLWKKPTQI